MLCFIADPRFVAFWPSSSHRPPCLSASVLFALLTRGKLGTSQAKKKWRTDQQQDEENFDWSFGLSGFVSFGVLR